MGEADTWSTAPYRSPTSSPPAARDGEVTRFSFEPPGLSDLFRRVVSE